MSESWDDRTRLLLGDGAMSRLASARVFVAGVGGVGGYAAEMLARSGVGHLTLVDADTVSMTNINRQLIALRSCVGRPKVDLFAERFRDINPNLEVRALRDFITPENVTPMLCEGYDFVIDAIDTVTPKVALLAHSLLNHIPIISSMGAGGRVDATKIGYFDLWETREDGLARAVRQRLKRAGLRRPLRVVASTEAPHSAAIIDLDERNKRSSYGTIAPIPAMFGIYLASHVINSLLKRRQTTDSHD